MGLGPSVPLVVVAPGDGGAAQYRSVALGLRHYNSDFTVTDGRLSVDLRLQVRAVAGAATGGTLTVPEYSAETFVTVRLRPRRQRPAGRHGRRVRHRGQRPAPLIPVRSPSPP
ncbi:hypothetical protein SCANM124S_04901 [Streptomyces canus]